MSIRNDFLADIWRGIRNIPGWLFKAQDHLGLSEDEAFFMSNLDDLARAAEQAWKPRALSRVCHRPEVDRKWAAERRREYLTDRIASLRTRLAQEKSLAAKAIMAGKKDWQFDQAMSDDRMRYLNAEIAKANRELEYRCDEGEKNGSGLTDAMIEKARAFDIRGLVDAVHDRITCPLHNGDPKSRTMSVAKGVGHCFQCGRNLDAIGWLMEVKKLDFVSAVLKLQ